MAEIETSTLSGKVMQMSTRLAEEKDRLIKDAITHCVGHENWCTAALAGRGELKILPDKTEIFAIDGKDLIHFMTPQTNIDHSHEGIFAQATQQYRLLY